MDAVVAGLKRCGYEVKQGVSLSPTAVDIFVTWNRIGLGHTVAQKFEAADRPVVVMENASWGNDFGGGSWLTVARGFHNTAACFPIGWPERWDALGVELASWRTAGETVILPQRGIGPSEVAMPHGWGERARRKYGGRIRAHPGQHHAKPLADDLARCGRVVTWGSGAAIKALMMGIPVTSEMPRWIGEQNNTDSGRLAMFRRLAWANWTLNEIETGEPFARMLGT